MDYLFLKDITINIKKMLNLLEQFNTETATQEALKYGLYTLLKNTEEKTNEQIIIKLEI